MESFRINPIGRLHEDSGNFTPQRKGGPYGCHRWFVGRNGTDRIS